MKRQFIFLIFMLVLSCHSNNIDYHLLIGSWKLRDVQNVTIVNETDKVTFFSNDSLSIEIFSGDKLYQQISGQYKIQENNKTITIKYEDNRSISIKILKLTEKEMELQNPYKKLPERYLRY